MCAQFIEGSSCCGLALSILAFNVIRILHMPSVVFLACCASRQMSGKASHVVLLMQVST